MFEKPWNLAAYVLSFLLLVLGAILQTNLTAIPVLLTQPAERESHFLEVCRQSGIPIPLLVVPFILALIPILFFPLQLAKRNSDRASGSLKALVSLSAFFQKVSIFLFAHTVLRILYGLTMPPA